MIRKLIPSDLKAFNEWAAKISSDVFFRWSRKELKQSFQNYVCWAQISPLGELQSVICFIEAADGREILWLATEPGLRGQGKMRELLEKSVNDAKGQTWLEVHEKNEKALNLYLSLGFLEARRRLRYYQDGAAAIVLSWNGSKKEGS